MKIKSKKFALPAKVGLLFILTILLSLLTACGAAKSTSAPIMAEEMKAEPTRPAEAAAGSVAEDKSVLLPKQAPQARIIIYTGDMSLVVTDIQTTIHRITELATKKGGYVSDSKVYQYGNGNIIIRVPAEEYQATLAELRALAMRVNRESSSTQDVTEEFVDLEARRKNLEVAESALQKLLDERQRIGSTSDILEVYRELTNIRGQIEQIEGRLRFLNNQAALSTISIELLLNVLSQPISVPTWQPLEVAREAFNTLVSILQNLTDATIWGMVCGLPLILVVFIPLSLVIWAFRRWRKKKESGNKTT